jgi:site-specific DNA-methyltransferase (adenine-specific)
MPKRPPRLATALVAPADLVDDSADAGRPRRALAHERGELWCGDALELLRAQPAGSVRLVVADPPYAIDKAEWDEFESIDAYVDWCDLWLAEVQRVLTDDGSAYVCGFSEILAEVKARSARRFVMNVDAVRVPYNDHTRRYPERIQAVTSQYGGGTRRDRWTPHPLGAKPRDVLEVPTICNGMSEKTAHPTQKPEELLRRLVLASSDPDDLIFDPFCGSGTTLVVAARHGRRWIGVDADPRYVGIARSRLGTVLPN